MDPPCAQRRQCPSGLQPVAERHRARPRVSANSADRPLLTARPCCGPREQHRVFLPPRVQPPGDPCNHKLRTARTAFCFPCRAYRIRPIRPLSKALCSSPLAYCKALSYMCAMKVVATLGYDRRARKLFTPTERAVAELEIALAPTAWPVIPWYR